MRHEERQRIDDETHRLRQDGELIISASGGTAEAHEHRGGGYRVDWRRRGGRTGFMVVGASVAEAIQEAHRALGC